MRRICHLTSAHPRYDTRIFVKECRSLSRVGYDVTLIVADGLGDELKEGVQITDVGKPANRNERMLKTARTVFKKALELQCDVYHLHDPELLFAGLRLKRFGYRVVYDAHEDVPRQILAKSYIPALLRKAVSWVAERVENFMAHRLDAVVAPTPLIRERFSDVNGQVVEVRNFPVYDEIKSDTPWELRENAVCYIGAITKTRGIEEMVRALEFCPVALELVGNFRPAVLQKEIEQLPGWDIVHPHGFVNSTRVREILAKSKVGLVVLHPTESYQEAIPIKMFEYMAAGIPFIASDFPFWRELLDGHECGIFVDPMDSESIGGAICRLMNDQELARRMGETGQRAVAELFNWQTQEKQLVTLYTELMS